MEPLLEIGEGDRDVAWEDCSEDTETGDVNLAAWYSFSDILFLEKGRLLRLQSPEVELGVQNYG